jgi:methionyl-tRNA formyltransferase
MASDRHELLAVVTRPDARSGRGRELAPSPVKQRALEAGIEVLTPARPAEPEFLDRLRALAPDCCPVVAYGALVPPAALEIPVHGWLNLHFSILPAWRGAAPVQHAILAGDDLTGATTFQLEAGLDTGPVYGVMTAAIGPRDTAGDLLARLARDGAKLLTATLDGIEDGALEPQPQPEDGVSLAPKLTTADARVDWTRSAIVVDRRVRAGTPAPGAWTTFRDRRLGLGPVVPLADDLGLGAGEVRDLGKDGGIVVGTGTGPVRLGDVRPEGRAAMAADAWARGIRPVPGDVMA